ncbi:MAG: type II secretion system protein [Chthoniobacterales bacterium]
MLYAGAHLMRPKRYPRSAFTLVEMIVVIAIIAALLALAFPAFSRVMERGRVTQDLSNLRQIGIAMQTYLNEHDETLPAASTWPGTTAAPVLYSKYLSVRKVLQSPFDKRPSAESDTAPVSYSINANMYTTAGINGNMARVVSASATIFIAPSYIGDPRNTASWAGKTNAAPNLVAGGVGMTRGTHSNGTRIDALFCDYHTETLPFGPAAVVNSFQDAASTSSTNPPGQGQKRWDPTR